MIDTSSPVAVIGAGTMGAGIAQIAATKGHNVVLFDTNSETLSKVKPNLEKIFTRLIEKGRMTVEESQATLERISLSNSVNDCAECALIIEAIIENADAKESLFSALDVYLNDDAIVASNTSSLSIAGLAAKRKRPERFVGIHFFNPAPLLPLVEIVPSLLSDDAVVQTARATIDNWGKTTVIAKDTPGFIVNRIARPFYGEALRILEEQIADVPTIDWAMKEVGGFRMGPFELMDLIGNDINNAVSETVYQSFYNDPRYRPSIIQNRMVQAGLLGKKAGRGFYDYSDGAEKPQACQSDSLAQEVFFRVISMLINEAADARYLGIASVEDIELAMTKGVNYPKGLLRWGDELGVSNVLEELRRLQERYGEDRYRASPLLQDCVAQGTPLFGTEC